MPQTGWASLLGWQVEFFFDLYRRFLASQHELASQAFEAWKRDFDEEAQKYGYHRQADFYEFYNEEYTSQEYSKVILMNSFFVSSYALYEHHRKKIQAHYSVTKSDLEGSDLKNSPEWKAVNHYKTIRDKIMHEGGIIPKCEEAVAFAECNGISSDYLSSSTYALTRRFCDEALDTFQRYLLMGLKEFSSQT